MVNNAILPIFRPPANLQDLSEGNQKRWSDLYINEWTNDEIAGREDGRKPLKQYFNPTKTAYDHDQKPISISWIAFPNLIVMQYQNKEPLRWQIADASRLNQDEYLEWSVDRDPITRKIIGVELTCEGPEYWAFMAERQPKTMFQLYQSMNPRHAAKMDIGDFFLTKGNPNPYDTFNICGVYNPMNIWNQSSTSGTIAHLIHRNNQLGAEIDITSQATVQREKNGKVMTGSLDLINCSQYGNRGRNSDPIIGGMVNWLERAGLSITINDPVALYIKSFDTSSLRLALSPIHMIPLPEGIVSWARGEPPRLVRISIKIPSDLKGTDGNPLMSDAGKKLTVSDIYDTGTKRYIEYGAQFADYIRISVSAVGISTGHPVTPCPCPCPSPPPCPAKPGLGVGLPGRGRY